VFRQLVAGSTAARVPPSDPAFAQRLAFALSRFEEGERTVALLERQFPAVMARRPLTVLDLGSGNGGMLFPFSGVGKLIAVDVYVDPDVRAFARSLGVPLLHLLGKAQGLPLRSGSIDLVLLAEVIEHLENPRAAGLEVARLLRPGGICLVSTPPRLKFLLRPDPHYAISGLLLLPDPLQRKVARDVFGRRDYDVDHIYSTTWGIQRLFPKRYFDLHVISHRKDWTRHLSWNYLAFERR
jgi:SAM-dependent methyltransferase